MRRLPDHELIARARRGSRDAAGVLFDRYWESAWKAAYAVTANRALADDVAQEAMQQAFSALHRFDETRPFGPWLKRIAANRAIDHLRRDRRLTVLGEHLAGGWEESGSPEDREALRHVAQAVATLDPPRRIVVVLRYWLDLPVDEIGGILGIPVGTVASRLSRGLAQLRAALEEERAA